MIHPVPLHSSTPNISLVLSDVSPHLYPPLHGLSLHRTSSNILWFSTLVPVSLYGKEASITSFQETNQTSAFPADKLRTNRWLHGPLCFPDGCSFLFHKKNLTSHWTPQISLNNFWHQRLYYPFRTIWMCWTAWCG